MDGHDRLDSVEEIIGLESLLEVDRYKACLPVMAVDQVGTEADYGQRGKHSLGEEREPGNLKKRIVRIRLLTGEESLVIYKVEFYTVYFGLQDAYIFALPMEIHIEVRHIFHLILHFLFHAGIFGNDDTDIVILFIDILRQ